VNRQGIAAALLTVAAAGSIMLVAREWAEPAPGATSEQICAAVDDLRDALDLSSLADQAVLRARAANLADILAVPSLKGGPAGATSVAARIVAVLDDPGATVADLSEAVMPIARQCRG
jgi:hypothetical protein